MTNLALPQATWSESSFRSTFQLKERHDSTVRTVLVLIAWFVSQSCLCDSNPPNQPSTKPSVTLPTFLYTSCPDHFKPQGTIKKTNARLYQTLWIHKVPHFIQTLLTIHLFVGYCYLPSTVRMIHRLVLLNLICQIPKFK